VDRVVFKNWLCFGFICELLFFFDRSAPSFPP
jgi:hypothetical protein